MANKLIITKILILALSVSFFIAPFQVNARTSSDVSAEIDQKNAELAKLQADLAAAQSSLDVANSNYSGAAGQLNQIIAQIAAANAQINTNNITLQVLDQTQKIKELEQEKKLLLQDLSIKNGYMNWRVKSQQVTDTTVVQRNMYYQSQTIKSQNVGIVLLAQELDNIVTDISKAKQEVLALNAKNETLKQQQRELQAQLAFLQGQVNAVGGQVAGMRSQSDNLKSNITQLSVEQRQLATYEAWIMSTAAGSGGSGQVANGQVYFESRGRDYIQGHQVGMSQYGAQGAALAGLNANQILQFYYTGTQVTAYPASAQITIKYCANNPVFDPYQDGGCDNGQSPVTERIDLNEYLSWLGEMPQSWHPEAQKAQIIAARTYALKYTNNGDPSYPICLTTYCQASYVRGSKPTGLRQMTDLVDQTNNQVVTYGGQLIETLYSAENNQGFGTADHDSTFQDFYGNATGNRPYLKAVNDNAYAGAYQMYAGSWCEGGPCRDYRKNTQGYKLSDLDQMLDFAGNTYSEARDLKNNIGSVAMLNFERDATNHVKKVIFTGTNGNQSVMGGWWFKSIWNSWAYSKGSVDYIYSQTFRMCVNQNNVTGCDITI